MPRPHGAAPPEQPSLYVQNWHDKVRLDEARQQATADYMDHLAEQSRGDGPAMAHAAATGAHYLLGACGFVPGAGDLACDSLDAGIYAAQGDATGTALSAASMIPFLGWATGAGKLTKLGAKSAKSGMFGVRATGQAGEVAAGIVKIYTANTIGFGKGVLPHT
jgi:hypothetical protein